MRLCTTRLCTALLCTDTIVHSSANQSVPRPKTKQATLPPFKSHNRDYSSLRPQQTAPPQVEKPTGSEKSGKPIGYYRSHGADMPSEVSNAATVVMPHHPEAISRRCAINEVPSRGIEVEFRSWNNSQNFHQVFFGEYYINWPTTIVVWLVSGTRRSLKSSSLVLGQYLDGWLPVRGSSKRWAEGYSFRHCRLEAEWRTVSTQVFRSFSVSSCKYDTAWRDWGQSRSQRREAGNTGGQKVKNGKKGGRGVRICKMQWPYRWNHE